MKVALDVDEVIADFYGAACRKCEVPFSSRVNHWEQPFITENWDAIAKDIEFWRNLEVLNIPDFHFDVYLTSVPEHIIRHRAAWLRKNNMPERPLIVSYDKVAIADELELDVLIDDKPANIEAWIESGRKAIQYIPNDFKMPLKSPYYTNDFGEIKNILNWLETKYYGEKIRGVQDVQTQNNPKEEELHDEFVLRFTGSKNLDYMIFGQSEEGAPKDYLSGREKKIVVSTVQWLGSPSGQHFLRSLGYCEEKDFIPKEKLLSGKLACLERQLDKIPKWIKAIFK